MNKTASHLLGSFKAFSGVILSVFLLCGSAYADFSVFLIEKKSRFSTGGRLGFYAGRFYSAPVTFLDDQGQQVTLFEGDLEMQAPMLNLFGGYNVLSNIFIGMELRH